MNKKFTVGISYKKHLEEAKKTFETKVIPLYNNHQDIFTQKEKELIAYVFKNTKSF